MASQIWSSKPDGSQASVTIEFKGGLQVVLRVYFLSSCASGKRMPFLKSWSLSGERNGTWVELDRQSDCIALSDGMLHAFAIDQSILVSAVRLTITGMNGIGSRQLHLSAFLLSGDVCGPPGLVMLRPRYAAVPVAENCDLKPPKDVSEPRVVCSEICRSIGSVQFGGDLTHGSFAQKKYGQIATPVDKTSFASFHQRLSHRCIMKVVHVSDEDGFSVYTALSPYGSLADNRPADMPSKLRVIGTLISGVAYLWRTARVVHRGLTPSNVIVQKDWSVKISGYWEEYFIQNHMMPEKPLTEYCAPEAYDRTGSRPIDSKTIVFPLSLMIYEVLFGQKVFPTGNAIVTMCRAGQQILRKRPDIPECEYPVLGQMIKQGWAHDSTKRCSLDDVIHMTRSIAMIEQIYRENGV